jgi:hypothetical protein
MSLPKVWHPSGLQIWWRSSARFKKKDDHPVDRLNLKFCRRVCERGYIIEKGRIVHEDAMEAIWGNEEIIQKYLVI